MGETPFSFVYTVHGRYFSYCDLSRSGTFDYLYAAPSNWSLEFIARFGNN